MSLFRPGENVWCVTDAARSGLLVDARAYYRAFYEACSLAKKSILIAGWQFDSDVQLLRGDDIPAGLGEDDVKLLPFLDRLCDANPDLRIDILAWDFNPVFMLERELLQEIIFGWKGHDNIRFVFDSHCPPTGSHHQKLVVVDGALAFVGGTDICQHRWDDRAHTASNALRLDRGTPYGPYHEVQAYVTGPAAARFADAFSERWKQAGFAPEPHHTYRGEAPSIGLATFELGASKVALARTRASCCGEHDTTLEIAQLLRDAILSAEKYIYIETQYFTAEVILDALRERIARGPLEITVVLPQRPESLKEEIAIGLAQARLLDELRQLCEGSKAELGVFNVVSNGVAEYIHSKLMIVDDRFLTVGSANLANRSMGLDTELNIAWEGHPAIPDVRRSLVEEHVGGPCEDLGVANLRRLAESGATRLRPHDLSPPSPSAIAELLGADTIEALDPKSPSHALFGRTATG